MVCLLSEHEGCVCQVRGQSDGGGDLAPVNPLQAVIPHQDLPFCSACEGPVSTAPHLTCASAAPKPALHSPTEGSGC